MKKMNEERAEENERSQEARKRYEMTLKTNPNGIRQNTTS
jgi:hypothetical protein